MARSATLEPLFSPGFQGFVELEGFEAIEQAGPAWDHTHHQLGSGPARVGVTSAHGPRMELAVVSRSPGVLIRGAPPRGTTVMGVSVEGPTLHLQRMPWERNRIGVLPRGREFEIISTTPNTIFELCVDSEVLEDAFLARWGRAFQASLSGPCLLFRDEASRQHLIEAWYGCLGSARSQADRLGDPGVAEHLQEIALDALLGSIEPVFRTPPVRSHREVALRAEAFLRGALDEPVRIEDVCTAVRASRPSLHAAFRETFGTSPMAYWKSLRLSAARSDLERARRGTTVWSVASRWSFFRFGYFSRDYRAMFGELPSETLQRATSRSGPGDPR